MEPSLWVEGFGCGVQDSSWLPPDVVGAAVCPFEAVAADVLRVGQRPSGYAYHWECILIQTLKSLFELKSLAKSMPC